MEEIFYHLVLPCFFLGLFFFGGFMLGRSGEFDKGYRKGQVDALSKKAYMLTSTFLLSLPNKAHVHIQHEGRKDDCRTNIYSVKVYDDGAEQRFIHMELTETPLPKRGSVFPFQSGNFLVMKTSSAPGYRLDPWDRRRNDS